MRERQQLSSWRAVAHLTTLHVACGPPPLLALLEPHTLLLALQYFLFFSSHFLPRAALFDCTVLTKSTPSESSLPCMTFWSAHLPKLSPAALTPSAITRAVVFSSFNCRCPALPANLRSSSFHASRN